jgi:hypothetical protein
MKKNSELCERPRCRDQWTHVVSGYKQSQKRGWKLRVCKTHANPYGEAGSVTTDSVGTIVSVQLRSKG